MKTINVNPSPLASMMNPMPIPDTRDGYKIKQEAVVLQHLHDCGLSSSARMVANNCSNIPGVSISTYAGPTSWNVRQISSILKRLERKGLVISILYGNARYYSVPVEGGED